VGAKRLPRAIRDQIDPIVEDVIQSLRAEGKPIEPKRISGSVEKILKRDRPWVYSELRNIAVEFAIDSMISDRFRDQRVPVEGRGRAKSIRRWYRVPGSDGRMIAKAVEDLNPDDLKFLEEYYQKGAMSRLVQVRALRSIRKEEESGMVQGILSG
jgi:hypothetical protein